MTLRLVSQVILLLAASLHAQCIIAQETEKQSLIEIAKETTFITEPLDAQGFVDYVAALNALRSKGVTPENNYEISVRKLIAVEGSKAVDKWEEKYFVALGIPVPKTTPFALVDFADYLQPNRENAKGHVEFEIIRKRETLLEKPWQPDERSIAARWVQEMSELLDELVEASEHPDYWAPYISVDLEASRPRPRVGLSLLAPIYEQREIARALGIRAMGRIGTGEL
ncbi:MAG: hypothetical protein AAF394_07150, partial [Planctomycetota bacterium]